jgi:hypothetical protein
MIKTQVQLPDELYRVARAIAKEREMSLAELVRRGLEAIMLQYPGKPSADWQLPGPFDLGLKGDPFERPDWREEANLSSGALRMVCEKSHARYGNKKHA